MRVLLIALQNTPPGPATLDEQHRWAELGSPMRTARMEEEHVLALARSMRDGGRLAPMLACLENSSLYARAVQLNLPVIPVSSASARNPFNHWRLWRWQRRHSRLLVQTVGQDAMPLGRSVLRMRKPGGTLLAHAFLLRAPLPQSLTGKPFMSAHKILCGSRHVQERLSTTEAPKPHVSAAGKGDQTGENTTVAFPEYGEKGRTLRLDGDFLTPVAPGMNLDDFAPSSPWGQAETRTANHCAEAEHPCRQRFIFGLADALTPRSGAQLVTRAMAAIWQRDDLPPWEVRALGGGPRYAELLEEAENLGVSSRLCLLNEQALPDVLQHCHAWISPGSSPEELPEGLWAGMAACLPTVCSKSSLHRERLKLDGHTPPDAALLVEENDPQALAKAMIDIMQDAHLRRRLTEGGQPVRPHIGLESFAARACSLYQQWCRQLGWLEPPQSSEDSPQA
ncbi:MAG: glycosyltransferase [Desulfovibrio sp.]|uniref:glycosyltransferase n=1 Tax=Desulfovibrio sp. TaxID=885 RepID=UPI0039E683FC